MKKSITMLVLALCAMVGVFAGNVKESSVPVVVRSYITKNYPQAMNVDWNYEKQGNYYKAAFTLNSADYYFDLTPQGKMINSKCEIAETAIPENIRAYIGKQYPGFKVKDSWEMNQKGIVTYQVDITGQNTDQTLYFSNDGMLLKKK